MKKYKKLIPIIFVILIVCCTNVSDTIFERITDGNSRGIEEISEEKETAETPKEIFEIIPSLFSISGNSSNPFMSSRFVSGRVAPSLFHIEKVPFWDIPEFIEPFFSALLAKQKNVENSIEEGATYFPVDDVSVYSSEASLENTTSKGLITLETNTDVSLSFSLNGESFEEYTEPIVITEPTVITVKTEGKNTPKFLLSSTFSYTIEKDP